MAKKKRYIKYLTSIFLLLFFFTISSVEARFQFTPTCQEAMQAILDLRFKDARLLIEEEKRSNSENGYVIYLEHYSKVIELIISENPALYEDIIDHYEERMEQMDERDDGTPDNAWLQAEMLFHTGLAQVKFGTRINGASKILSSYKRIREHRQKYPLFWQNEKLAGVFNILFDHIPPFMRWAAEMFGFSGDSETGMFQVLQYCDKASGTPGLAEEAVLFANLSYKLTQQEAAGFRFLQARPPAILETATVKYLYANAAIYSYQNDLALKLLTELTREDLQVDFYGLDYVTGRCKLNRLDPDADVYLERYLDQYPGLDYKKDACNRLSYYYFLQGDVAKFRYYRERVATVGQELRDRDQEAVLESRTEAYPDKTLLAARLLCDGGYFDRAMETLNAIDPGQFTDPSARIEYYYRKGRITELKGQKKQAVHELEKAYQDGRTLPYTFATRAAFYLGKIYEEQGDFKTAALWYDRCIEAYSPEHTTEGILDSAERGAKRAKAQF